MVDAKAFIGRTFGGSITIVEKLGEGGMGAVFRGRRPDGSSVAVKILTPALADDAVARARFEREAAMASQIDHPNAVRVFSHGEENGLPYLVMELVDGHDLCDLLADVGRLSSARAAAIVAQVCDAMATAHDRGIVHRDLKPENIMLSGAPEGVRGERVKLLDFGVAKRFDSKDAEGRVITVAGAIIGTPAYMSPEQCLGEPLDARSDVYACGAVLYHLVTGHVPFEDDLPMQTLFRHVNDPPTPPSRLVGDLDPGLEVIILKALQKRPEDRHQGAHELWEDLLAALPRLLLREGRYTSAFHQAPPRNMRSPTKVLAEAFASRLGRHAPSRHARVRRWAPLVVGLAAAGALGLAFLGGMGFQATNATNAGEVPAATHVSAEVVPR